MGNFGSIVAQNYASFFHRIRMKDLFETLQHDRLQPVDKNHLTKTSPKILFGPILAWLWVKIMQACITGSAIKIFFKLCSMIGHNK